MSPARLARPDEAADVIRLASIMYGAMGLDVSPPVARGVAERQDAAGPAAPVFQGDEQVAVGRDREVSRRAHLVRDDERTEAWREREAAVVGIARG